MYIANAGTKTPETLWKNMKSHSIECHNCSHEKSLWRKIKEQTLSLCWHCLIKTYCEKTFEAKLT
jgi:predicted nucleic acid-binding Zn ribbon protein